MPQRSVSHNQPRQRLNAVAERAKHALSGSFGWAMASGLMLWAALPPLNWWCLAWLAPLGWLWLIQRKQLPGAKPYRGIYLAGLLHWLIVLQGMRHAHWATYLGWIALTLYLGMYLPVFVAVSRVAVHRLRVPLVLAAPLVWTGLELVRGHMITGFSMGLLAHTQVHWLTIIQISDLCGAYGVSFLVMMIAAAMLSVWTNQTRWQCFWPAGLATLVLIAALSYGAHRLGEQSPGEPKSLKVALIQGSVDTEFHNDSQRSFASFLGYLNQSARAARQRPDLIIWPEGMYTGSEPEWLVDSGAAVPLWLPLTDREFDEFAPKMATAFRAKRLDVSDQMNRIANQGEEDPAAIYLMVGTSTEHFQKDRTDRYNTAMLLGPTGEIKDRYYKMHPVMFGEYVPLGNVLPWLYQLMPIPAGLTPGTEPRAFTIAGAVVSPSICFESTVPHLIRRQVMALSRSGRKPDLLANLTDDGWFWGSSMLDLHLNCGVFRAIEMRTPFVVAANTGFSAMIDGNGNVLIRGPRRAQAELVQRVTGDGRSSPYLLWGDTAAGLCSLFVIVVGLCGLCGWRGLVSSPFAAD